MTIRSECASAEKFAGAIAIGEANDAERDAYRGHIALCGSCLDDFGGEREIERVMGAVAQARAAERWEPDLRVALARKGKPHRALAWGAAIAAAAILAFGIRSQGLGPAAPPHRAISAQEARALAALDTQTTPHREGRAESLAVGTTALSTSFQVSLDEKGLPIRCTIVKSSGDRALDQSVCRAAMHRYYVPGSGKGR